MAQEKNETRHTWGKNTQRLVFCMQRELFVLLKNNEGTCPASSSKQPFVHDREKERRDSERNNHNWSIKSLLTMTSGLISGLANPVTFSVCWFCVIFTLWEDVKRWQSISSLRKPLHTWWRVTGAQFLPVGTTPSSGTWHSNTWHVYWAVAITRFPWVWAWFNLLARHYLQSLNEVDPLTVVHSFVIYNFTLPAIFSSLTFLFP